MSKKRTSVLKAHRRSVKRRARNRAWKTKLKNLVKNFMAERDVSKREELLKEIYSVLDKMAQKGVIHSNTCARKKSKLTKLLYSEAGG